jgi:hypothetical protein
VHRRHLVTGIPAILLAATTPTHAVTRKPNIDEMAAELAHALEEQHGGVWKSTVDSGQQFVIICRE